jgi:hypothetical protein
MINGAYARFRESRKVRAVGHPKASALPKLAIGGLWLASGLVTTDSVGIKKQMLCRSCSLRWDEITEIRLLSKDIGAIDLPAGSRKLIIESRFLGFQYLLDEIRSYTNLQPIGTLPQWLK